MPVADQDEDAGSGVAAAEADVVQAAVVPQGDHPAAVDGVLAGAPVGGVDDGSGGAGFGPGAVGLGGGAPVEGAVRADGVVVAAEGVELPLQVAQGGGGWPS